MKGKDHMIERGAAGMEQPHDQCEQQDRSNHELWKTLGNRGPESLAKELDRHALSFQRFDLRGGNLLTGPG